MNTIAGQETSGFLQISHTKYGGTIYIRESLNCYGEYFWENRNIHKLLENVNV